MGSHYSINAIETSWNKAIYAAGIKPCPISHARHTYAAKILTESGDLRYVQHQLGFATIAFAALYADVRPACNNENSYSEPHIVGNMMSA